MDKIQIKTDTVTAPLDPEDRDTQELYIEKEGLSTISEVIALLEEAKNRWGDQPMMIYDTNTHRAGGFSSVLLSPVYNEHMEKEGEEIHIIF